VTLDRLLIDVAARGVTLHVEGGDLRVRAPKGALTPDLRAALGQHKPAILARLAARAAAQDETPLRRVPRTHDLPLSHAQRRLWFLHQMEGARAIYHVPACAWVDGPLNLDALRRAIAEIPRRHEALRTTFTTSAGEPVQVIGEATLSLDVEDFSATPDAVAAAEQRAAVLAQAPFDLIDGPLVRGRLLRAAPERHLLALTFHHIVADAWSMGVFLRELAALYEDACAGRPFGLAPLTWQYADVAAWQHERLQGDRVDTLLAYWRGRLAGVPEIIALPTDRPRPAVRSYRGAIERFAIDRETTQAIAGLAARHGATLFQGLLAAFQVLLHRYSGQDVLAIGSPIANRARAEIEPLMGFFANTLALRGDVSGDPTFAALLARVQAETLDAYTHQDLPFEMLVTELAPGRSLSHNPLFQVMFALQNAPMDALRMGDATLCRVPIDLGVAKFDLYLSLERTAGGELAGEWEYATDLFDAATIRRMSDHFQRLVADAAARPDTPIGQLSYLSDDERRLMLGWHARDGEAVGDVARDESIAALVAAQVGRTPDRIAAIDQRERLTYRELDQRANRLAHHLRRLGVGPDVLVGVCVERSCDMIAAVLGILKAGGAYVPLDPAYPRDRLAFMIEDAAIGVVVTQQTLAPGLPGERARIVLVDDHRVATDLALDEAPPDGPAPEHLAYVIYTSGSTGQPKGILIEHRQTLALLAWARTVFSPEDLRGTLAASSLCFDLSVFEIFLPLSVGGTVIVAEHALALPLHPAAGEVTLVNTVPAAAAELVSGGSLPRSVRVVNLAGEPLPAALVDRLYGLGHVDHVYDLYGPSETTTYSTFTRRTAGGRESIGRPIAGTHVYILDRHLQPVPIGVRGEIYIGGAGVTRGYLHRDELTRARYLANPFAAGRLYRTGDAGRFWADGNIAYLGRLDDQVKIRGVRIEPGEVDAVLARHADVRESVIQVAADANGGKRLVAYFSGAADVAAVRAYLQQTLPRHAVPTTFVRMDALPRTPNGKIDRHALPPPDAGHMRADDEYVPPGTRAEAALCGVWEQVLRLDRVGVQDNFFQIGGDSILAIQVIARARAHGLALTLPALFQHQTVAELAGVAGALAMPLPAAQAAVDAAIADADIPLTGMQRWCLANEPPAPQHFNQWVRLQMPHGIADSALRQALDAIVDRHAALRLRFAPAPAGWRQWVDSKDRRAPIEIVDLRRVASTDALGEREDLRRDAATDAPGEHDALRRDASTDAPGGRDDLRLDVPTDTLGKRDDLRHDASTDAPGEHDDLRLHVPTDTPGERDDLRCDASTDAPGERDDLRRDAAADAPGERDEIGILGRERAAGDQIARLHASLDLEHGPLLRAALLQSPDGHPQLLLLIHHLAVDAVSWRILCGDLIALCAQAGRGEALRLPDPTAAFGTWARRVDPVPLYDAATAIAPLPRDIDLVAGNGTWADSRRVAGTLTEEETRALVDAVPQAYRARVDDALLAALAATLAAWSGAARHVVDVEGHGRDAVGDLDVSHTVGWFTAIRAVTLQAEPDLPPGLLLQRTKEASRTAPRTDDLAASRAQVSFNYLGQLDSVAAESGWSLVDAGLSAAPARPRSHLLAVTAQLRHGRLAWEIEFTATCHTPPTIAQLSQSFGRHLRAIVGHCRTTEAGGYTPSDFPGIDLGQADLDALIATAPAAPVHRNIASIAPVSDTQAGILFQSLLRPDPEVYVMQVCLRLEGPLDPAAFRAAWELAMARHRALRTCFLRTAAHDPVQVTLHRVPLPFSERDLRDLRDRTAAEHDSVQVTLHRVPQPFSERDLRDLRDRTATEHDSMQVTLHRVPLPFGERDLRDRAADDRAGSGLADSLPEGDELIALSRLARLLDEDRRRGFDLASAPLMRVTLARLDTTAWACVWTSHHAVLDGWSLAIVLRDVAVDYARRVGGVSGAIAPPSAVPAGEYRLVPPTPREVAAAEAFWTDEVGDWSEPLDLSFDSAPAPATGRRGWNERRRALSPACVERITTFARRQHLTRHTVLQGTWALLLARCCDRESVIFGGVVSGRAAEAPGDDQRVGLFIRTVPIRVTIGEGTGVVAWLRGLQQRHAQRHVHGHLPLVRMQALSRLPPATPLFDMLFVFENYPIDDAVRQRIGNVAVRGVEVAERPAYPLTVIAAGDDLALTAIYDTGRFADETIETLLTRYEQLLLDLTAAEGTLGELSLAGSDEQQRLLLAWNDTARSYPRDRTIVDLFEEQVDRTPDAPAIVADGETLTYAALDRRANRLAHDLQARGVGPDVLVGLSLARSIDLIVAIYGVLKAGGAYVPIDPDYPEARRDFMRRDCGAAIVLDADRVRLAEGPTSRPPRAAGPGHLAYAIYTSGSTGQPKGALNTHDAVVNRLRWMQDTFALRSDDAVLQKTPCSFDVSVWEFFWPLLAGARLVLARPGGHVDPDYLADTIARHRITTVHFVPAMLRAFLQAPSLDRCQSLRRIIASGEALSPDLVRRCHAALGAELHNLYGPTEAAVDVTWWPCPRTEAIDRVPIGRPIANTQIYIVDRHGRPRPIGLPGELCIGGVQVGRGYWNQPALTAARFVPDPFSREPGARLYRTGDLARFLADGTIEYLGRGDGQVKIRGVRIELAEIEAALRSHPDVRDAIVQPHGEGDDRGLVAYVVSDAPVGGRPGLPDRLPDLRAHLRARLPESFVPGSFVSLPAMPLLPNGKIDRRALRPASATPVDADADTEAIAHAHAENGRPGQTHDLEQVIAEIWRDVLGVDSVGRDDHFFDLGGHSLRMIRVHGRLRTISPRPLRLLDLFEHPTIRTLARYMSGAAPAPASDAIAPARSHPAAAPDDIAVIAMVCRVPGAASLDAFWQNLVDGRESLTTFSQAELLAAGVDPRLVEQPRYVPTYGALADADHFDAAFFDVPPREAAILDPQQRVFLECAWEALERAGYDASRVTAPIGIFAGAGPNTYAIQHGVYGAEATAAHGALPLLLASDKDYLATRVAYKLNLTGPALTVQTACSTSLVAIALASASLQRGECAMALAGGVTIRFPQTAGYLHEEGLIFSADGHCRAFDARADGMVGASGAGLVVLKRLADAVADGDRIHAVIKGVAMNNDGAAKVGYTAPSLAGQTRVIVEALDRAGVDPATIRYVEAHGTGTPVGDPIELAALTRAWRTRTDATGTCALGSVKTNIGHLDAAAGVAGFIKAALVVEHGQIPPSLHFETANPRLELASSPFFVNATATAWPADTGIRRAAVSSFGIGGTNAHVVIEQAPAAPAVSPSRPWQLLTLSARTAPALDLATTRLADALEANTVTPPSGIGGNTTGSTQCVDFGLADAAFTLLTGRRRFQHRRVVVCRDRADAVRLLRGEEPARRLSMRQAAEDRPVVFLFSGYGAQYPGMGAGVYAAEPVFREVIDRGAAMLQPHVGGDIRDVIFGTDAARLRRPTWAQPALFLIEYALAQLWLAWGVRPVAMLGHSVGEYVAACLAGVFSLDDVLPLIAARGRLIEATASGAMLAVAASEALITSRLPDDVSIAVVSGPADCVVSGPASGIEALSARLRSDGIDCRRVDVDRAMHSGLMDPAVDALRTQIAAIPASPPRMPFVSNVTGTWIAAHEATDPAYWAGHLRATVQLGRGVAVLCETFGDSCFLEVGPGRTVATAVIRHPSWRRTQEMITTLRHPAESVDDEAHLLDAVGRLWAGGVRLDDRGFYAHERRRRVALPTYPFERKRYVLDDAAARPAASTPAAAPRGLDDWFYLPTWERSTTPALPATMRKRWLLFGDDGGPGETLAALLRARGAQVTRVTAGEAFATHGDGRVTVRPTERQDYERLLDTLGDASPEAIVHLWSLDQTRRRAEDAAEAGQAATALCLDATFDGEPLSRADRDGVGAEGAGEVGQATNAMCLDTIFDGEPLHRGDQDGVGAAAADAMLDRGFFSLLALTQALADRPGPACRLAVVTPGAWRVTGDERLQPLHAAVLGPIRVAPQEIARLGSLQIDLATAHPDADLLRLVVAEIESVETVVAYRHGLRWIRRFAPHPTVSAVGAARQRAAVFEHRADQRVAGGTVSGAGAADGTVSRTCGAGGPVSDAHVAGDTVSRTPDAGRPVNVAGAAGGTDLAVSRAGGASGTVSDAHVAGDTVSRAPDVGRPVNVAVSRAGGASRPVSDAGVASGTVSEAGGVGDPASLRSHEGGGLYLVTGGLGGVGLELAEAIAERTPGAHLLLVGRTAPADRQAAAIARLHARHTQVHVRTADVTDLDALHRIVAEIEAVAGPLCGVVHAAGIAGGGTLPLRTRAAVEAELAAKIRGTIAIHQLTASRDLDFVVLCASTSAITGGFGSVAYTAANAFQDAFSEAAAAAGDRALVAIDWHRWQGTGMAIAAERLHHDVFGEPLRDGMPPDAGREAMRRILDSPRVPRIAVCPTDLAELERETRSFQGGQPAARPAPDAGLDRPDIGTPYVAPASEDEVRIAEVWREVLGIGTIGIHDPFTSLGGDSLLATRIVTRLRASLDVPIAVRALYEQPTIAELAHQVIAIRTSSSLAGATGGVPMSGGSKPASGDAPRTDSPPDDRPDAAPRRSGFLEAVEPSDHRGRRRLGAAAVIPRMPRGTGMPVSMAQQRLWFLYHLDGRGATYNVTKALRLRGPLDADRLEAALRALIARHEPLRTVFETRQGEPIQVIHEAAAFHLHRDDLSDRPAGEAASPTHGDTSRSAGGVAIAERIEAARAIPDRLDAARAMPDRMEVARTMPDRIEATPAMPDRIEVARTMLDRIEAARALTADEAHRAFDLTAAPLLRARLIRLADEDHVLVLVLHHIAADGRSLEVLLDEVATIYAAHSAQPAHATPQPSPLAALPVQYADYARFERDWLKTPEMAAKLAWWRRQLDGAPPLLALPTDRPRPATPTFAGGMQQVVIPARLTAGLRALGRAAGASLYMTVLAAFTTLMSRYSGQDDVCIGSPIENRPFPETADLIGAFVNTIVMRTSLDGDPTFADLLRHVRSTALDAYERQDVPFEWLVQALHSGRNVSAPPIVQVAIAWLNARKGLIALPQVHADAFAYEARRVKFDLNLEVYEAEDVLHVAWFYNTDLFDATTTSRMIRHFVRLLESAVADPSRRVSDLDMLSPEEQQVNAGPLPADLVGPADPAPTTSSHQTVCDLFEAQVAASPETTAVVFGEQHLTYRALDRWANRIAHGLIEAGAGPGVTVALLAEHSFELVAAVLGILKSGAAYLPLDTRAPDDRLRFILDDAGIRLLLATADARRGRTLPDTLTITDIPATAGDRDADDRAPAVAHRSLDAAYIIYTSGSTGQPKGVLIEHRALVNYLTWASRVYDGGRRLAFPLFTSLTFDLTVTSLFVPLISGGRIVIYRDDPRVPAIFQVFADRAVHIVKLTPAHLAMVQHLDLRGSRISAMILGGEDLKTDLCRRIHDASAGAIVIDNEYGPTEATVGCMIHRFDPASDRGPSVPIGRPAAQVRLYILDRAQRPVPPGVRGELYIGGDGVARGYAGRPDLTAERFLPDPFVPGARMYRSGDLARRRPDGVIEYDGRADHQVKIRGHRIEPDEIAAVLAGHEAIADCVVHAVEQPVEIAAQADAAAGFCATCGLAANYPGTQLDDASVCDTCRAFAIHRHRVERYFQTPADLARLFAQARTRRRGDYDGLALVSGGKDSVYMLARLQEMGLRLLAFTLDPGYLSDAAKENIRQVTARLGVDHVFGGTPHMNEIFVESLRQHANVCNGCFKTLYTLSIALAKEKGIPVVITGLSRGQLFETRLSKYWNVPDFDADAIDSAVLDARKIYHRLDDVIARRLDVSVFQDDRIFDDVEVVDFYRYVDVSLGEMLASLEGTLGWRRPEDTGRSTNCLINDVGIYVHRRARGYHNYALPYAWDVRMGHKRRDQARAELDDQIDVDRVRRILAEIGWTEPDTRVREQQLAAYYVPRASTTTTALRAYLAQRLPEVMIPSFFVPLDQLPLTRHGKIDRDALPPPHRDPNQPQRPPAPPRTFVEREIAAVWTQALGFGPIGIHDNFFALGGHSLMATRVAARLADAFRLDLPLAILFSKPTVAELAEAIAPLRGETAASLDALLAEVDALSDDEARTRVEQ
jgi:polyketide synthase PksJ